MIMELMKMSRIYIACLAAYNNGILHGEWIDVTGDIDDLRQEISRVLKASPEPDADEWAIHDHENCGPLLDYTETPDLEEFCDYVRALSATKYDRDLIHGVMDNLHCNIDKAIEYIEDNYLGIHDTLAHWAEDFLEQTSSMTLPPNLQYYFDYERYARESEINGDILSIESKDGVHVFFNN